MCPKCEFCAKIVVNVPACSFLCRNKPRHLSGLVSCQWTTRNVIFQPSKISNRKRCAASSHFRAPRHVCATKEKKKTLAVYLKLFDHKSRKTDSLWWYLCVDKIKKNTSFMYIASRVPILSGIFFVWTFLERAWIFLTNWLFEEQCPLYVFKNDLNPTNATLTITWFTVLFTRKIIDKEWFSNIYLKHRFFANVKLTAHVWT